nr:pyridoxamine 5'-phosphate oxidase family protein [Paenibacillus sp. Marseille-Q4541]
MNQIDITAIKNKYLQFIGELRSVMLSTLDEEGNPFISYAPFVAYENKIYIYISRIANHYHHMDRYPRVDVLLVEDEANSGNLFARQRARFPCTAKNVGNEGNEEVFALFEEQFPAKMVTMLRGLDFSLFELTPQEGRYVAGFGLAFDLDLAGEEIKHVARDGHTSGAGAK